MVKMNKICQNPRKKQKKSFFFFKVTFHVEALQQRCRKKVELSEMFFLLSKMLSQFIRFFSHIDRHGRQTSWKFFGVKKMFLFFPAVTCKYRNVALFPTAFLFARFFSVSFDSCVRSVSCERNAWAGFKTGEREDLDLLCLLGKARSAVTLCSKQKVN